jgi:hypothetical protein
LTSGSQACLTGVLPLEPCPQSLMVLFGNIKFLIDVPFLLLLLFYYLGFWYQIEESTVMNWTGWLTLPFSSKDFILLAFTYSPFIYFVLIFTCSLREEFNLFNMWLSSSSSAICWKTFFFPPLNGLGQKHLSKSSWQRFIARFSNIFHWSMFILHYYHTV